MNNSYHGVWPVMLTPFDKTGKIDFDCYCDLLDWYVDQNVDGIFSVCGSSEMSSLDYRECLDLARMAVKRCDGRIPVVATGSLGRDFSAHKQLSLALTDVGVNAVMLLLPSFCSTEAETLDYLLRMADAVPGDLGVYECPGLGIQHLSPETLKTLARTGRFGPFKETSCDIEKIVEHIRAVKGTQLSILQANTPLLVDACRAGASGIMGICINIVPGLAAELYRRLCAGESTEKPHQLMCIVEALLRLKYPASGKIMLSALGFPVRESCRAQSTPISSESRKLIEQVFDYVIGEIKSWQ